MIINNNNMFVVGTQSHFDKFNLNNDPPDDVETSYTFPQNMATSYNILSVVINESNHTVALAKNTRTDKNCIINLGSPTVTGSPTVNDIPGSSNDYNTIHYYDSKTYVYKDNHIYNIDNSQTVTILTENYEINKNNNSFMYNSSTSTSTFKDYNLDGTLNSSYTLKDSDNELQCTQIAKNKYLCGGDCTSATSAPSEAYYIIAKTTENLYIKDRFTSVVSSSANDLILEYTISIPNLANINLANINLTDVYYDNKNLIIIDTINKYFNSIY